MYRKYKKVATKNCTGDWSYRGCRIRLWEHGYWQIDGNPKRFDELGEARIYLDIKFERHLTSR
jgi:hypothetical protein